MANPVEMARALTGLARYQQADRRPTDVVHKALASHHGGALRELGGDGPVVLLVPSLINPPTILDLPGRSFAHSLAGTGRRVLLLDWGPADERRSLSIAGHVEHILLPLIRELDERPDIVGYCLGGTMALAAALLQPARSLTLLAAPWRFSGFEEEARARLAALWNSARSLSERLGVLPMEVLQAAFWSLDPERTVAKFSALADADDAQLATFVQLEDWANDGPPLPHPAASELLEECFAADRPGSGRWFVGGQAIDPAAIACPILNIVSTTDRIVPAASAASVGERIELRRGHVGMVVGSRAERELWQPLGAWLSRVSPTC